mgnify:CR=1 FL=1
MKALLRRTLASLNARESGASLALFRGMIAILVAVSVARFEIYGWADSFFLRPRFFFSYPGFSWVKPPGPLALHGLFLGVFLLTIPLALGWKTRLAAFGMFLGFLAIHLFDVTNYLNHYVLLLLLLAHAVLLPLGVPYGLDGRTKDGRWMTTSPRWPLRALRFQVGIVYFFAGIAKANSDWLFHGQPLAIWLAAREGLPLVGPLFALPGAALVMSWCGFLFDTSIPFLLSHPRLRRPAYVAVLFFHALTSYLFPIGLFPWIMVSAATVFFAPDWPLRLLARRPVAGATVDAVEGPSGRGGEQLGRAALVAFALHAVLQILVPLRTFATPGPVAWHEQGMRFSWRVMLREKNAAVTYLVEDLQTGRVREVPPREYLDDRQEREFATQPDLLLQLGSRIAADEAAAGRSVRVRVDAVASWNGRRMHRLVDDRISLDRVGRDVPLAAWILPAPTEPPPSFK